MIITYHGHACFKLKGKRGTIVTDPYNDSIGLSLPRLSADIVTVSHDHDDHSASSKVTASSRRDRAFVIDQPGEYEVAGISVFGVRSYHDDVGGAERGENNIFTSLLDEIRVCHLGDLGHELTQEQLDSIGSVDILLCPVGGHYTIDPATAVKVIRALEPSIAIPMHYRTAQHDAGIFGEAAELDAFLKEYGVEPERQAKLDIELSRLPEETQLVVLEQV